MEPSLSYVPVIFIFPIVGLIVNAFWGKRLGRRGPGVLASAMAGLSFVTAVVALSTLVARGFAPETVVLYPWIEAGPFKVDAGFLVDTLSVTMCLVVTGVGTLIHIYAIGYMDGDPRCPRFFVYMNLFLASMLVLVLGSSYGVMFVGWELVGLCSYLLIGFWFDKGEGGIGNAIAAKKAFVVNRIGDFGFLLGLFLMWTVFGSLNFSDVLAGGGGGEGLARVAAQAGAAAPGVITAICLLLLIGATGKSAQIPLFVWLPDAMAGPTPVSALIHAATMVTAGVYMITRSHVLFDQAPAAQAVVALIGAATALVAGTIAVAQFDIKRVLAFSTISQLGFMIAAVGMGAYVAGMFHLVTHAFFKALLFLGAGSVIHGVEHGMHHAGGAHQGGHGKQAPLDPQDMRNMGGLWRRMPITAWTYLIGALALAGIFPLAGFWSKDEILGEAFLFGFGGAEHGGAYPWVAQVVFFLLLIAAGFTAFYMARQLMMIFFGAPRTEAAGHATESVATMTVPLIALAALSLLGGALNLPIFGFLGMGAESAPGWIGATARFLEHAIAGAEVGTFNLPVASIALLVALGAGFVGLRVYQGRPATAEARDPLQAAPRLFEFLRQRWYWDHVYEAVIVSPYKALARFLTFVVDDRFWKGFVHDRVLAGGFRLVARIFMEPIDTGVVDGLVNGIARLIGVTAERGRRVQTGYVRNYALSVLVGVVLLVAYFIYVAVR